MKEFQGRKPGDWLLKIKRYDGSESNFRHRLGGVSNAWGGPHADMRGAISHLDKMLTEQTRRHAEHEDWLSSKLSLALSPDIRQDGEEK